MSNLRFVRSLQWTSAFLGISCAIVLCTAWIASQCVGREDARPLRTVSSWPIPVPSLWPAPSDVFVSAGAVSRRLSYCGYSDSMIYRVDEYRYGWPFPCLSKFAVCEQTISGAIAPVPVSTSLAGVTVNGLGATLPIWPNSVYVVANIAILFMFFSGTALIATRAHSARRNKRMQRNACQRCGYTLMTLSKCPECGLSVERQDTSVSRAMSK